MDIDSIVDYIVQEVYNKINTSPKNMKDKKLAVIMGDINYEEYSHILDNSYTVIKYDETIEDCDLVIVPFLCIKGMGNLANLTISSKSEYFITKMLLGGKKVYVLEDGLQYRKYKNTASKAIYNRYLDFEDTLKNFGIQIIKSPINLDNKTIVQGNNNAALVKNINTFGASSEIRNKKLISESDVRKCYFEGSKVILVDEGSIITPLAKDFIKMNNISIIKNNGG